MSVRGAAWGGLVVAAFALFAGSARANGRFPAAGMLVARPGDSSELLLRATYGLLLSRDGGEGWDWICERAVGYGGTEDPTVVITGSGALVVGMFDGIARSTDGGCTWSRDPQGPRAVVDLALRPGVPERLYAVTCAFAGFADAGGSLFHSEVLVSEDAGAHWVHRAVLDPTLLLGSVEVAASDPGRLYVSAVRGSDRTARGVLLVSDDGGAHFVERPLPLAPEERGAYVAAVAPDRADRVYVRTDSPGEGRLRVTDDSGRTWRTALEGGPLLGFALSPDGARVFAGGPREGLLTAAANDLHFSARSTLPVQCLSTVGATLWACAAASSGFVLGASTTGGTSFSPRLTLAGMRGPLQCAKPSALDACSDDWTALRSLVGTDDRADAASPSAAVPPPRRAGCHCALPATGAPGAFGGGMWALAATVMALRRRRRGRHRGAPLRATMPPLSGGKPREVGALRAVALLRRWRRSCFVFRA